MDALLSVQEVVKALGVSRMTLHRLRKTAGFPSPVNMGIRAVRFRRSDLEEWLRERRA